LLGCEFSVSDSGVQYRLDSPYREKGFRTGTLNVLKISRDKVTDKAGSFLVLAYAGQGNAIAQRQGIDLEEDAKLFRAIGHEIEKGSARAPAINLGFCCSGRNQLSDP
jgi:hypothetical protein